MSWILVLVLIVVYLWVFVARVRKDPSVQVCADMVCWYRQKRERAAQSRANRAADTEELEWLSSRHAQEDERHLLAARGGRAPNRVLCYGSTVRNGTLRFCRVCGQKDEGTTPHDRLGFAEGCRQEAEVVVRTPDGAWVVSSR